MSQYRNMQNQGHSVFPKSPLPGREGEGRGIAERADMPMRDMESHKPPQYTKMWYEQHRRNIAAIAQVDVRFPGSKLSMLLEEGSLGLQARAVADNR